MTRSCRRRPRETAKTCPGPGCAKRIPMGWLACESCCKRTPSRIRGEVDEGVRDDPAVRKALRVAIRRAKKGVRER